MRFIPEDRGRIVTIFLENFFKNMLNMISRRKWKSFWMTCLPVLWNGKAVNRILEQIL